MKNLKLANRGFLLIAGLIACGVSFARAQDNPAPIRLTPAECQVRKQAELQRLRTVYLNYATWFRTYQQSLSQFVAVVTNASFSSRMDDLRSLLNENNDNNDLHNLRRPYLLRRIDAELNAALRLLQRPTCQGGEAPVLVEGSFLCHRGNFARGNGFRVVVGALNPSDRPTQFNFLLPTESRDPMGVAISLPALPAGAEVLTGGVSGPRVHIHLHPQIRVFYDGARWLENIGSQDNLEWAAETVVWEHSRECYESFASARQAREQRRNSVRRDATFMPEFDLLQLVPVPQAEEPRQNEDTVVPSPADGNSSQDSSNQN